MSEDDDDPTRAPRAADAAMTPPPATYPTGEAAAQAALTDDVLIGLRPESALSH